MTKVEEKKGFFNYRLRNAFDKFSKVKIFRGFDDGLSSLGSILLFASLFVIAFELPETFGLHYSEQLDQQIDKIWLLCVGLMSWFFSGTIAKYLTEQLNDKLKIDKQIDSLTTMLVAMTSYLLIVVTDFSGDTISITLNFETVGLQGILTALIVSVITSYTFYFIRKYLILNRKESNIPGSFFDKIVIMTATAIVILFFWGMGWIWQDFVASSINSLIDQHFSQYVRKYADSWWGIILLYCGYALSWFTGIHGPTVFAPLTSPINVANDYQNQQIFLGHLTGNYHVATWGVDNFIVCFGGTGATFVVPFLFMIFCKSKKLKKVGKTSAVSTAFGANEPILFGGPMILNWAFFVPMLIAPIINVLLLKVFITFWGMRGFVSQLNWTTPGPLGIIFGTGLDWKSVILTIGIILVDSLIYLPSVLYHDRKTLKTEMKDNKDGIVIKDETTKSELKNSGVELTKKIQVLIICAGGATSGALAKKLEGVAAENNIQLEASGSAWGRHKEQLAKADFVILAPQVANNLDVLQEQLKINEYPAIPLHFRGIEYIHFSQEPILLLNELLKHMKN
jgi:PTS system lactose-specific IIC component